MDNAISGLPLDVDLKIKTEPEDTGYEQYTYDEDDDLNIKLEIKEEIDDDDYDYDDDDDDEFEDDAYSPASSILLSPDSNCKVEIVEQPIKKVRFRYLSELQGTPHGPLLGEKHTKHMKTFPEVRLVGYEGKENVKISCWLVDKPLSSKGFIRPHCHDLVVRKQSTRSEIVSEPHERSVSRENNYTAIFENMVVLHSVQKGSESKYLEKEIKWHRREGALNTNIKMDKKKIQDTIRSINKNEVYLYFEAFIEYQNSIQILCSALSHPIKNLKNPISGDLKICKVLNNFGPCEGNTEVGLFTEKVPPDVKIKFFNRENRWTEIVTPEFVHRNIALTFRTPHYPSDIVDDSVQVNFCLLREADGAESNYMDFTYHLNELKVTGRGSFKRRRYEDHSPEINSNSMKSEDSTSQGSLVQDEIIDFLDPELLHSQLNCDFDDPEMVPDIDSNTHEQWSGTSLESMLDRLVSKGDPMIGFNPALSDDSIEADGPIKSLTQENGKVARVGDMSQRCRVERVINDILLTNTYKDHINCLQMAVMSNQVDVLKKILTSVQVYVKSSKDLKRKKITSSFLQALTKIKNDKSQTLLHTAVTSQRSNLITHLLEFGFDPLFKDGRGNNSFHLSVKASDLQALRVLVNSCIKSPSGKVKPLPSSVLLSTNFDGQNILHLAVRGSNVDIVEYIVKSALVDINLAERNSGDTALHLACRLHLPGIAQVLLQNGADTSLMNLQGYAPLHLSVTTNDHDMAKLLIKEKSDPSQCISLWKKSKESDGTLVEEAVCPTEELQDDESYQTSDAFSLALDLMMVDILSGNISKYRLEEDFPVEKTCPEAQDKNAGRLLTKEQVDKLSPLLKENDTWRLVAKKLNKSHIEALCKGFDYPEKVLLDYIQQYKDEILGKENALEKLADIFSSLDLSEAQQVLEDTS